jgi:hypothetical protein
MQSTGELKKGKRQMSSKVIMDTNVPAKAATPAQECKKEELEMHRDCMEYIKQFTENPDSKLVIDQDHEILKEYYNRIPENTGAGKMFLKWLNAYIWRIDSDDFVKIEKDSSGNYVMFPLESRTEEFDLSDRKFVALSRTHEENPPIIEAADSKWLGFKEVFAEYGVHIEFLNLSYAARMYERKVGSKRSR